MNILVVDDNITVVSIHRTTLTKKGYTVFTARDGKAAAAELTKHPIDIVLTDWLMPELDGFGLITWIRAHVKPAPIIIMITSLESVDGRVKVLDAGADAYLVKPVQPQHIIDMMTAIEQQRFQRVTAADIAKIVLKKVKPQQYSGVGIVAGTSGAAAIRSMFKRIATIRHAAFFVVLHGPGWASEALADQIQMETPQPVVIPTDGQPVVPGTIYVAPGDKHMIVSSERSVVIRLESTPPENFLRPSADPLFRSIASTYGKNSLSVVLGGTGCDGAVGCGYMNIAEGVVIVQDPSSSVSPQMPKNVITLGLAQSVLPLEKIPDELSGRIRVN